VRFLIIEACEAHADGEQVAVGGKELFYGDILFDTATKVGVEPGETLGWYSQDIGPFGKDGAWYTGAEGMVDTCKVKTDGLREAWI
jgi:hypothetical protein